MGFRSASGASWSVFDIPSKEAESTRLEALSADPAFWLDSQGAQKVMRRLASVRESVTTWRKMESDVASMMELVALAIEERDQGLAESLAGDAGEIASRLDQLEFQLTLSGLHDDGDAILAVHAGAGGTESQDWAEMLLRMYLRWAEKRGFAARVLDSSPGEEAGIKSATLEVSGGYVHGWLKAERGVHRLVRLSPFNADHLRHTSFALVEVWPETNDDREIVINEEDLRIDTFRSGGHGGQNVQKVETAVRVVHKPSGIVVTCQNERSQAQNRETAMKILRARLLDLETQRRAEEQARLKGQHVSPGWGNQIRSYVLHPYKLVKDHRTGHESRDPQAVLDGDLDEFIKAHLVSVVGEETPS
jgi:peptide chain release factor 2